jgi:hemerythrin-like metal-binding protein
MRWSEQYSVGVKALDDEHEEMMRPLNEIHAAAMKGKIGEVASRLLDQVTSTSREHFSTEEALMEQTKYPGLAEHRAIHQALLTKAAEFVARHDRGDNESYVHLLYFVREWFLDHMLQQDRKYTVWMNEHGVK